jgi:hypothetical protein
MSLTIPFMVALVLVVATAVAQPTEVTLKLNNAILIHLDEYVPDLLKDFDITTTSDCPIPIFTMRRQRRRAITKAFAREYCLRRVERLTRAICYIAVAYQRSRAFRD